MKEYFFKVINLPISNGVEHKFLFTYVSQYAFNM